MGAMVNVAIALGESLPQILIPFAVAYYYNRNLEPERDEFFSLDSHGDEDEEEFNLVNFYSMPTQNSESTNENNQSCLDESQLESVRHELRSPNEAVVLTQLVHRDGQEVVVLRAEFNSYKLIGAGRIQFDKRITETVYSEMEEEGQQLLDRIEERLGLVLRQRVAVQQWAGQEETFMLAPDDFLATEEVLISDPEELRRIIREDF